MEAVSGLVTLLNLLLSVVVGVRLLRRGRPESRLPELSLAAFFLATGFAGTALAVIPYGLLVQGTLGPLDLETRLLVGFSQVAYLCGAVGVYLFTWRVFRPAETWARGLAMLGVGAFALGIAWEALTGGFAIVSMPGFGYWLAFVARVGVFLWTALESLSQWSRGRRRLTLGLADPLVTNRFLLWGIWSATLLVSACSEPVVRALYADQMAPGGQIDLAVGGPIILITIAVTSALASVSLVTLALTFFPPRAYERWIGRGAADGSR